MIEILFQPVNPEFGTRNLARFGFDDLTRLLDVKAAGHHFTKKIVSGVLGAKGNMGTSFASQHGGRSHGCCNLRVGAGAAIKPTAKKQSLPGLQDNDLWHGLNSLSVRIRHG